MAPLLSPRLMNVIPQVATDGVVRAIGPLARVLVRSGVTPKVLATIGALVTASSAAAFGCGRIRLGGGLLLASGLCGVLGDEVARQGGGQHLTTVGALYDSLLKRVGETMLFGGIAFYFLRGGAPEGRVELAVGLAIAALAASLLAAYVPARAEGLGLQARAGEGLASRRGGGAILVLGALTLAAGAARDGWLLFWIVAALSLAAAISVVHGVIHIGRTTGGAPAEAPPRKRDTLPGHAPVRRREH